MIDSSLFNSSLESSSNYISGENMERNDDDDDGRGYSPDLAKLESFFEKASQRLPESTSKIQINSPSKSNPLLDSLLDRPIDNDIGEESGENSEPDDSDVDSSQSDSDPDEENEDENDENGEEIDEIDRSDELNDDEDDEEKAKSDDEPVASTPLKSRLRGRKTKNTESSEEGEVKGKRKKKKDEIGSVKKKKKSKNSRMRRNIKKIMSNDDVNAVTLRAQLDEAERLKRVEERAALLRDSFPVRDEVILSSDDEPSDQHLNRDDEDIIEISEGRDESYSEKENHLLRSTKTYEARHRKKDEEFFDTNNCGAHTDDRFNVPDDEGRVLVNVGHPDDEEPIFLPPHLARVLKPHQIGGIRFMYDNIIDNIKRSNRSEGFGCILAHSMGLGKTLQVISFIDIYLTHTNAKYVLCIVPINTLQNWSNEFNMWLPGTKTLNFNLDHDDIKYRNFNVYMLNDCKTLNSRAKEIRKYS